MLQMVRGSCIDVIVRHFCHAKYSLNCAKICSNINVKKKIDSKKIINFCAHSQSCKDIRCRADYYIIGSKLILN